MRVLYKQSVMFQRAHKQAQDFYSHPMERKESIINKTFMDFCFY